jgi:pimeloyl-ACP methyl ester carboxylesterase
MRTVVVYVHGLWLGGGESFVLLRRLSRALGAECRAFKYSSAGATITDNVASLEAYLGGIEADTLHLLAHSMGGLLLVALFDPARVPGTRARRAGPTLELPPGRIVLTGSPSRGCLSAARCWGPRPARCWRDRRWSAAGRAPAISESSPAISASDWGDSWAP